jgi:hypothetical protein
VPPWNISASGELIGFVELGGECWPNHRPMSPLAGNLSERAEPNCLPAFSEIRARSVPGKTVFASPGHLRALA